MQNQHFHPRPSYRIFDIFRHYLVFTMDSLPNFLWMSCINMWIVSPNGVFLTSYPHLTAFETTYFDMRCPHCHSLSLTFYLSCRQTGKCRTHSPARWFYRITPHPIFPPASPDGWDLKSSGIV